MWRERLPHGLHQNSLRAFMVQDSEGLDCVMWQKDLRYA